MALEWNNTLMVVEFFLIICPFVFSACPVKFLKTISLQSIHRELLEEFTSARDFFTIFFKEAKSRNSETEDIVKGIMQGIMQEFVSEMRLYPGSKALSDEEIKFTVMYMIGGMMQIVECYLFDDDNALTIQEIAERITNIETKIKGL